MPVAVTESGGFITINDGASSIFVSKSLVTVSTIGTGATAQVKIQWSATNYSQYVYTDFTAPTGASAVIVAAAIAAFISAGSEVLAAGDNHIGNVGGETAVVTSTITMSAAGAYATGEYMGTSTTPQSFAAASRVASGTGVIKSIFISDKITNANVVMELWLFSDAFVAPTDNAAWAISDTEQLTFLGAIDIVTTGWKANVNGQVYYDGTICIPIKLGSTKALWYALVARGTTPAFTSGDLTIGLGILQD